LFQLKLYFLDGGEEYFDTMAESGEPAVPSFEWIVSSAKGRPPYTVAEIFKLNGEREAFRARALAHWNATALKTTTKKPVDAILTPIAPTLAPPHDSIRWWGYSSYWNLLDYPAAVFPVGRLDAASFQSDIELPQPRNEAEQFVRAQWDPLVYDNSPIALQASLSFAHY
jgi:amidase